ncbi:hypothetical protein [Planococcus chinensis]|uniref:SHOCT domain-containing protein n=1 Tax=Planococcus chinensis TaxID=272917 RepID=A0ABW4QHT9_9BACL
MPVAGFIPLMREDPRYGWFLLIHIALLVLAFLLVFYTRRIGSTVEKVNYANFLARLLKEQFNSGEITEEEYRRSMCELEDTARRHLLHRNHRKE